MEKIKALKLKEIPYRRYEKLQKFVSENLDEDILSVGMLSIYYDITQQRVRELSLEEIDVMLQHITVEIGKGSRFNNIIQLNGVTYGFIPNFQKITAGELIDLDTLLAADDWVTIFSILYRPLKGKIDKWGNYEIQPYGEFNSTLFEDVSAADVIGCKDFFLKSYQNLNLYSVLSTQ